MCVVHYSLNTPNELCPALVSLVFLHTFFGLAQFCKRPCNPVFDVLQFFKNDCTRFCITSVEIEPTTFPARNVALTIGIPSSKHEKTFFHSIIIWTSYP